MRTISYGELVQAVEALVIETSYVLPADVCSAITDASAAETTPLAADILHKIGENARIASSERLPLCQDTGFAVFFADMGCDVRIEGGLLNDAIQEGTRRGYRSGGLRMSIVADPLTRANTGDNTPAVIHCRQVSGDRLSLWFCPKGGGCENMSRVGMLTSGDGVDGVMAFVEETVREGGGKPCPPLIVGVGIGGTFEYAALLSKRSLFRKVGERHTDTVYADIERSLKHRLNETGIGPMGLGGDTTVLDVFIEAHPCHIASLPVAVNIQCHSARHGSLVL